jgi:hypothetical protein
MDVLGSIGRHTCAHLRRYWSLFGLLGYICSLLDWDDYLAQCVVRS